MQNASRAPETTWRECSPSASTQISSPGATSRRRSAPMMSSAQDSLATQYLPSMRPRTIGRRPAGSRKATRLSFVMRTVEKAPCRRGSTSVAASSMRSAAVGGQQRGDDLRVRRRAERDALLAQLVVQLDGVDEVAVVAERQLAAVGAVHGLGVVPAVGAGRRVADVADGDVAAQRAQLLLVEDLVDEPQLAQGHDVPVHVGGGDAGRLLTTVLEGVEREVGQSRDVVAGGVDPEHSALVAWSLALVEGRHDVKNTQPLGVLRAAMSFPGPRGLCCARSQGAVLPPRPISESDTAVMTLATITRADVPARRASACAVLVGARDPDVVVCDVRVSSPISWRSRRSRACG